MTSSKGFRTPLSADAVRAPRFESRRRGFDPDDVLIFLNRVANDIEAADAERAALRSQLHAARMELQQLRQRAPSEHVDKPTQISVHAVELLSQAQQIADSRVAAAEQYARDLIETARRQYQDVLHRAQQAAAASVRGLEDVQLGNGVSAPEIEYVRTYARVAQVQLRSVLEALTHEVDKLGQIGHVDDYRSLPRTGSEDTPWQPATLVSVKASRTSVPEPTEEAVEPYGRFGTGRLGNGGF